MAESILFIPDISGFTKFVKTNEINHAKHIIEELINIIIEEGRDELEVAEVEGDAVFFYTNKNYSADRIVSISKRIFIAFHKHLLSYEYDRICSCGACTSAVDLQLKFIIHAGEISLAQFGSGNAKPFGDSVIEAHQLLKNDIAEDEYLLFTKSFLKGSELEFDGEGINSDTAGKIEYKYFKIDHWKSEVILDKKELKEEKVDLEIKVSKTIPVDSALLHAYILDFKYRNRWSSGVSEIKYDENEINQTGSEHFCVVNGKNLHFDTIKPDYEAGLSYGEILKNPNPFKYFETNFLLKSGYHNETELTFVMKVSFKWFFQRFLKSMIAGKLRQQANIALNLINDSVQESLDELKGIETPSEAEVSA